MQKKITIITHLSFVLMLCLLPVWGIYELADRHYAFSGMVESKSDFSGKNPVIGDLVPNGRLGKRIEIGGIKLQPVILEPVYVSLKMSRPFKKVRLKLLFHPQSPDVFYMGPQIGEGFEYNLMPVRNALLDRLSHNPDWRASAKDGLILYQYSKAGRIYETPDDFFSQPPPSNHVAVFNYSFPADYKIPGYEAKKKVSNFSRALRGSHSFFTYIEDEPLDYTFVIQDINRHNGRDDFTVNVLFKGRLIHSSGLADDGFTTAVDPASGRRTLKVVLNNLQSGAYKIGIKTTEDVLIRKISSPAQYMVFENKMYLVDNPEYSDGIKDLDLSPVKLVSNGSSFSLRTAHHTGLQTVIIQGQPVELAETHLFYYHDPGQGSGRGELSEIVSPKNDILIQTDGLLALSDANFFDPRIKNIDHNCREISEEIHYIIARYSPCIKQGSLLSRTYEVEPGELFMQDHKLKWMISSPGLEKNKAQLLLSSLSAELYTDPVRGIGGMGRRIKEENNF